MNERLSKEIERYEEENHGFEGSSRYDCICIAQHFYNLALEDVKKKIVERIRNTAYCKTFYGQLPEDKKLKDTYEGMNTAFHEINGFIDNLTK